MRTNVKIL